MNVSRQIISVALLALFFMAWPVYAVEMVVVARDGAMVRDAPDVKANMLWRYDKGLPLKVIEAKGDWRKVSDFEGDGGWLRAADLNKEPHMVVCGDKNTGKKVKVNIRKGPGENYQVVGQAVYGAVFAPLGRQSDWVKVRHDSGLEGWMKRDLLWGF
jgi:SH3-like domain-containing protein